MNESIDLSLSNYILVWRKLAVKFGRPPPKGTHRRRFWYFQMVIGKSYA